MRICRNLRPTLNTMKNEDDKIFLIERRADTTSGSVACVDKCVDDEEIQKRKRETATEIWRPRLRNREEKQASQESRPKITDSSIRASQTLHRMPRFKSLLPRPKIIRVCMIFRYFYTITTRNLRLISWHIFEQFCCGILKNSYPHHTIQFPTTKIIFYGT